MPRDVWTDEFLDRARHQGDELADATVAAIFTRGDRDAVNEAFDLLLRNEKWDRENLPLELREFLTRTETLPDWADPELIRHAEKFFMSWGVLSLASLAAAALPECYTLADEARVLAITKRLTAQANRRILETAQLTVRVMDENGLKSGRAVRAAQTVRLLHATMRRLILEEPPAEAVRRPPGNHCEAMRFHKWDKANDTPISQEHLAYTLLTFSFVLPRSLQRFGARVSERDWIAHLHCWNVVGHVLGLRRELMAETKGDAEWLFARIKQRHQLETKEGCELTTAVIGWMKEMLPFQCLGWLPPLVTWMLLDRDTAKKLGVPEPGWFARMCLMIYRALPSLLKPNRVFGRWFVSYATTLPRGWERELFDLPASLKKRWRVKPRKRKPAAVVVPPSVEPA